MKPTDEQIKKFWKWCGFRIEEAPSLYTPMNEPLRYYKVLRFPDGEHNLDLQYPLIDPNNLFKYAVPKLFTGQSKMERNGTYLLLCKAMRDYTDGQNPALALFWAIWKVIENGK